MAAAVLPRPPLHRRAAVLAVVAGVHALLLWMLLHLAGYDRPRPLPGGPTTVTLIPDAADRDEATTTRRRAERQETRRAERQAEAAPPRPAATPLDTSAESEAAAIWRRVMPLSRSELAAADIARTPAASGRAQGDDAAERSAAAGGGGGQTGPNGETLYDAEWQRRPTSAELHPYLPANGPEGWGLIACRTVAGNRVEDCVELGQSPAGSGLSRAVRQAAWQFRVLPPRVGGRAQVGAWVRIRIDYSRVAAE